MLDIVLTSAVDISKSSISKILEYCAVNCSLMRGRSRMHPATLINLNKCFQ